MTPWRYALPSAMPNSTLCWHRWASMKFNWLGRQKGLAKIPRASICAVELQAVSGELNAVPRFLFSEAPLLDSTLKFLMVQYFMRLL